MRDEAIDAAASATTARIDCLAMRLDRNNGYRNPGRKAARYIVAIATC